MNCQQRLLHQILCLFVKPIEPFAKKTAQRRREFSEKTSVIAGISTETGHKQTGQLRFRQTAGAPCGYSVHGREWLLKPDQSSRQLFPSTLPASARTLA